MLARDYLRAVGLVMALTAAGCKDDPPEDALYGELDPPDANRLAGVYQLVVADGGMTTEIRLEFEEGKLSGAVRCTPKNTAIEPIGVGGETGLSTNAIDAASGKFTIDDFSMEKSVGDTFCQGGLRGGTYDFKIESLKLTLTIKGIAEPIIYGKLGQRP